MNIGINTRLLIDGKMDGIGWFACETLERIVKAHPEHDYYFFFDRQPSKKFIFSEKVHPVELCPPARHPVLWYMFFEWSIARAIKKYNIDLFVSPDGYMPTRCKIPTLDVIHDLNFEHAKGNLKKSHQLYMGHYFPRFARKATRIATVSEYSKNDIASTYSVEKEKIDVVYDGAHTNYHPYGAAADRQTRETYTQGKEYFIFVSTILKRKNLANLLLAFDAVRETHDIKLVVVGAKVWWQDELEAAYNQMKHREDVVFVGRAEPDTLAHLLSAATALVYPSFFEGFGIPILESFYAETPVVTSNTTSMPEIAGDAALLTNPTDFRSIAKAMEEILLSPGLRQTLIERGRTQRQKFSWEKTASLLWDSMMKTYNTR